MTHVMSSASVLTFIANFICIAMFLSDVSFASRVPPLHASVSFSFSFPSETSPFFATNLTNETFFSFSVDGGGFGAPGRSVKFLCDNRTAERRVYFIDANFVDRNGQNPDYVKYHYFFAQKVRRTEERKIVGLFCCLN